MSSHISIFSSVHTKRIVRAQTLALIIKMTAAEAHDVAMVTTGDIPDHIIDSPTLQSRISQSKSIQIEDAKNNDSSDNGDMETDLATSEQPTFQKLSAQASRVGGKSEYRRIRCPAHRYTPLRENWEQLLTPLVEYLKLQVRFNTRTRSVEMKTSRHTLDTSSLQKGADFVGAFMLG